MRLPIRLTLVLGLVGLVSISRSSSTNIDDCDNIEIDDGIVTRQVKFDNRTYDLYDGPDYSNGTFSDCRGKAEFEVITTHETGLPSALPMLAVNMKVKKSLVLTYLKFYESTKHLVPAPISLDISDEGFGEQRTTIRGQNLEATTYKFLTKLAGLRLTDKAVSKVCGSKLNIKSAAEEGLLFKSDFSNIVPLNAKPRANKPYLEPVIGIFCKRSDEDKLLPLYIHFPGLKTGMTPLDSNKKWLASKVALNAAENNFQQIMHFSMIHSVIAALKACTFSTMKGDHPIRKMIHYHSPNEYGTQVFGLEHVFAADTIFEQVSGMGAENAVAYMSNFFKSKPKLVSSIDEELQSRGMLNETMSPFNSYTRMYVSAFSKFMSKYVSTHYKTDRDVENDLELSNWRKQCSKMKHLVGLSDIKPNKKGLIEILTQVAVKTSVVHQSMNEYGTWNSVSMPYSGLGLWVPLSDILSDSCDETGIDSLLMPTDLFPSFLGLLASTYSPVPGFRSLTNAYDDDDIQSSTAVSNAVAELRLDIESIGNTISAIESKKKNPYIALLPGLIAANTWM